MLKIIIILIIIYNIFEISIFKKDYLLLESSKVNHLKITQISDFHNNKLVNKKRLIKEINKFNPDFIVLTGDIISRSTDEFKNIENLLSLISSYKVYFVQGNHERDNVLEDDFYKLLDKYNIENLSHDKTSFIKNNISFKIYGNSFGTSYDYLFDLNEEDFNILLTHDPKDYLTDKREYDLVLSGHTHGGQVRIPFLGQIIDHGPSLFPEYSKGLYKEGKTNLYISSGLGQNIPIRIFNRISYTNIEIK